jgi:2-polyprenyl-3-methyl-5-hydroxy-6-metoxy-1,4-benzoquinol methylase
MPTFHPCTFSPSPAQARLTASFLANMFPGEATVLDVGFGEGYFLEQAQKRGLKPFGVDRDPRFVESARDLGYEACVASATELLAAVDGPFDGVVAQHLIEHLTPPDAERFLQDVAKLVRPGGLLVIVTPNFRDWRVASELFWFDPTHVRPYNRGTLLALAAPSSWRLEASGNEPLRLTKRSLLEFAGRLRYGREYGRSGKWYRLRRE